MVPLCVETQIFLAYGAKIRSSPLFLEKSQFVFARGVPTYVFEDYIFSARGAEISPVRAPPESFTEFVSKSVPWNSRKLPAITVNYREIIVELPHNNRRLADPS